MARGRPGIPMDRVTTCRFSIAILPVRGHRGSMLRMSLVVHMEAAELREDVAVAGSCAERWKFSAEEFITARRSMLVVSERKAHKALWLGIEDVHEENRVDVHPSLPCVRHAREFSVNAC